jgi:guanosine-3',5'-bis(diphosphate) 3'-pyrophosphohydrolase
MRLRKLFEGDEKSVGLIFGRFNPPHVGHKAAWEMAAKNPAWYVGTNKSTQGKKDPLPYDVKVQAMTAIMPEVAAHIVPHQSWLTLASEIYKKHPGAVLKVYTDEAWVIKTLQQYNGVEGKQHGYYNFPGIDAVGTPRLSSATALRDAVAQGNREAFTKAAGISAETDINGTPYFDIVNKYMLPYLDEAVEEDSDDALKYATKQHTGQTRSDGSAYIKHPERVGNTVAKLKKSKNLDAIISAAYLHDTIEDTDTTHEDLEKMFGGLVASIVKELTSDKEQIKKIGKEEYLTNKMIKMSSYSLVVKLADRLDNVQDIATAKTPEWRENYKNQTLGILSKLEAGRELSNTHKQLISMIKDKLQEINSEELGEKVMKAKMFTGYSKGNNKKGHPDKGKLVGEAGYEITPQQKQLIEFGRKLMEKGAEHSDDNVSAMMSKVGNNLVKFGAPGGSNSIAELEKVTGVKEETILKMMEYAKSAIEKEGPVVVKTEPAARSSIDSNDHSMGESIYTKMERNLRNYK